MTKVQFLDIKPFVSCCKDLVIVFHIPSSIKASNKHYIALCELLESSQFTWVWAGKTEPLEQEGITVKWRKGKVTFANQVLPKLSDGREYYLMYCNEVGTILGESRPFQFSTESDEFSSIDLQSTPSDDVVMISMHGKKAPPTSSSEAQFTDDTASFEVISEQTYSNTEPTVGDKEKGETEYCSQSVTSTVVPKNLKSTTTIERTDLKDDDKLLTSSYTETKHYHNLPMESTSNPEDIQLLKSEVVSMKAEVTRLKDEVTRKENVIEELQSENATLKEQIALHTLSNSTVLVNSPKEDKEKKIMRKRIQDEAKKSARLEELLDHKEAKLSQLENEKTNLVAELNKKEEELHLVSQNISTLQEENKELKLHKLHTQHNSPQYNPLEKVDELVQKTPTELLLPKQQNSSVELTGKIKLSMEEVADLSIPVEGDFKTKLYIKLFKQDPFICHVCNEVLPAHTQEFTRLNHVQHCKGLV